MEQDPKEKDQKQEDNAENVRVLTLWVEDEEEEDL